MKLLQIVCETNLATYCGADGTLAELKVMFSLWKFVSFYVGLVRWSSIFCHPANWVGNVFEPHLEPSFAILRTGWAMFSNLISNTDILKTTQQVRNASSLSSPVDSSRCCNWNAKLKLNSREEHHWQDHELWDLMVTRHVINKTDWFRFISWPELHTDARSIGFDNFACLQNDSWQVLQGKKWNKKILKGEFCQICLFCCFLVTRAVLSSTLGFLVSK